MMDLHLASYGNSIKVRNGMFSIEHQGEQQSVAIKDVRSIFINKSTAITADTLFLAVENGIDVVLTTRSGKAIGRIWSAKYGSISIIRKKQIQFSQSNLAIKWVANLLATKCTNQRTLLYVFDSPEHADELNKGLVRMGHIARKLERINDTAGMKKAFERMRGIEGVHSRIYFQLISQNLPREYQFKERSQRPARDMFNALLNYSYGVLYGKIEGELIKAGLDPYTGIFHRDEYNTPVLVFDVIERFRIWADAVVINLCMQHVIFEDFFEVNDQAWFLNDFGKKILITALTDFFEETIDYNGQPGTRMTHIKKYCVQMATLLKEDKWEELCSI